MYYLKIYLFRLKISFILAKEISHKISLLFQCNINYFISILPIINIMVHVFSMLSLDELGVVYSYQTKISFSSSLFLKSCIIFISRTSSFLISFIKHFRSIIESWLSLGVNYKDNIGLTDLVFFSSDN